jgi:hypothetical protein
MLQVLVSIQSLILIEQPYFNEPGYEKIIGTPRGDECNEKYNQKIRQATAKWAIADMIQNPPSGFEEVVKQHFNLKKDKVKEMLQDWEDKANHKVFKDNIIESKTIVEEL